MTIGIGDIVKNIATAAQQGDFIALRREWQSLYDELKKGRPIEDTDAYRLIAALDEAGTFDHLAGDGSAETRTTIAEIIAAAKSGDDSARTESIAKLRAMLASTSAPLRRDDVDNLLTALRNARAYDSLAAIAEQLIARGQDHARLRRLYGQSLIERGQLTAAIEVLQSIFNSKAAPDDERNESIGLLGRSYKQLFMQAPPRSAARADAIRTALSWYRKPIDLKDLAGSHWHLVNVISLTHLAAREGIVVAGADEAVPLAHRLAAELAPKAETSDDTWMMASLGEAHVARGDWSQAAHWYGRFAARAGNADDDKVTPFHLASAIRQLEEVWGLKVDETPSGQLLLALKTKLLTISGGQVILTGKECADVPHYNAMPTSAVAQSVLGASGPMRYEWLCVGMKRPPAIARICRGNGIAEGTGFLVDPDQLSPKLAAKFPGQLLLLTNNHVIADKMHASAMSPAEARIIFTRGVDAPQYNCSAVWESPINELDATLLTLDPPIRKGTIEPCPIAEDRIYDQLRAKAALEAASDGRVTPSSNVFIMGHPMGQELCISLHDTEVLDKGAPSGLTFEYLHYRTPTHPGHSGSPVFDESDWQVIALHHAGSGTETIRRLSDPKKRHKANEGISMKSIRRRLEEDFKNRRRFI